MNKFVNSFVKLSTVRVKHYENHSELCGGFLRAKLRFTNGDYDVSCQLVLKEDCAGCPFDHRYDLNSVIKMIEDCNYETKITTES